MPEGRKNKSVSQIKPLITVMCHSKGKYNAEKPLENNSNPLVFFCFLAVCVGYAIHRHVAMAADNNGTVFQYTPSKTLKHFLHQFVDFATISYFNYHYGSALSDYFISSR